MHNLRRVMSDKGGPKPAPDSLSQKLDPGFKHWQLPSSPSIDLHDEGLGLADLTGQHGTSVDLPGQSQSSKDPLSKAYSESMIPAEGHNRVYAEHFGGAVWNARQQQLPQQEQKELEPQQQQRQQQQEEQLGKQQHEDQSQQNNDSGATNTAFHTSNKRTFTRRALHPVTLPSVPSESGLETDVNEGSLFSIDESQSRLDEVVGGEGLEGHGEVGRQKDGGGVREEGVFEEIGAEERVEEEEENSIVGGEENDMYECVASMSWRNILRLHLLLKARRKLWSELFEVSSLPGIKMDIDVPELNESLIAKKVEEMVKARDGGVGSEELRWVGGDEGNLEKKGATGMAGHVVSLEGVQEGEEGEEGQTMTSRESSTVNSRDSLTGGELDLKMDEPWLCLEEWQSELQAVISDVSSMWNTFLKLHRQNQDRVGKLLRRRWDSSRSSEASLWLPSTEERSLEHDDVYGIRPPDWVEQWRNASTPLAKKAQEERAQFHANRADLYRSNISDKKCNNIPFQDMQYFAHPSQQPIMFGELYQATFAGPASFHHPFALPASPSPSPPSSEKDAGISFAGAAPKGKGKGKHVVVFVHGFQGNHLDLRIIRNHWLILDPSIECIMSNINEERTHDSFADCGHRLAEEVAKALTTMFSNQKASSSGRKYLQKLSFAAHSVGTVITRTALTDKAMEPFLPFLYTFLSIAGPHLGYLYSSNSLFNGGLWVLKRFKGANMMLELTLTDHPDMKDCFLYQLSQKPTFEYFQNVILLSSPQDRYVPYHSARVEMCPAAIRDTKRGGLFAKMINGCLSPVLRNAHHSSASSSTPCPLGTTTPSATHSTHSGASTPSNASTFTSPSSSANSTPVHPLAKLNLNEKGVLSTFNSPSSSANSTPVHPLAKLNLNEKGVLSTFNSPSSSANSTPVHPLAKLNLNEKGVLSGTTSQNLNEKGHALNTTNGIMANAALSQTVIVKKPVKGKRLLRCDINFDVSAQARTLNNFIGRTAHIEFLETDVYIRFLLWNYREYFV
eukprot:TRINITY_DN657_c0_g1_i2.p1 TRINITY_DN657_c0_g1~~TRINITY_DN657_c0_g1_i2.p1  ORF type:complete len:1016 (-),score=234.69 TRINITY_DN657_c0_g1_i2:939-3986(-)